jgi:hypothetical protein
VAVTPVRDVSVPGGWRRDRLVTTALAAAVVGLVLWLAGVALDPRQALASYLFAYAATLTIAIGALVQVMISHVTAARWFTVLRRLTLNVAASLPALAVLLLPLLLGVHALYPWASPEQLAPEARTLAARRHSWLNVPFFIGRAAVYVAVWTGWEEWLRAVSLRQDGAINDAEVRATRAQRRLSALGLVVVGLTLTFAAFDWLMTLDPLWYSAVYGLYVFAGGFLAALGLVAVIAHATARREGRLDGVVTAEHFGALGKLLLTFVIFWGYIAFSQYLIIWIGDIPADASWYVVRASGSWGTLAIVVAVGQFALPFVLLLSRTLKRRPAALAAIGVWLVLVHLLDVYWLVLPAIHPDGIHVSWMDVAACLMVGGFATATAVVRSRRRALVPLGDPYLEPSVQYAEP